VYLVLLVAAGAILGGVVVVAMGRGGQIANFRRDVPIPALRFRTPDEVALARLPLGLFGYQVQATGDVLAAAASLVDERNAEIAWLRRELLRLGGESVAAAESGGTEGDAGVAEPEDLPEDLPEGGVAGETAGVVDPAEPRWRQ
jgi:hypothetical protein